MFAIPFESVADGDDKVSTVATIGWREYRDPVRPVEQDKARRILVINDSGMRSKRMPKGIRMERHLLPRQTAEDTVKNTQTSTYFQIAGAVKNA